MRSHKVFNYDMFAAGVRKFGMKEAIQCCVFYGVPCETAVEYVRRYTAK